MRAPDFFVLKCVGVLEDQGFGGKGEGWKAGRTVGIFFHQTRRRQSKALHTAHQEPGTGLAFTEFMATFNAMKLLVRTLLVLAALAYGVMPLTGVAAMVPASAGAIPASAAAGPAASGHALHVHGMQTEAKAVADSAQADVDCPHPGKSDRGLHCAACLTLPAALQFAIFDKQPRAAEAPSITVAFASWLSAPLDPPPRI